MAKPKRDDAAVVAVEQAQAISRYIVEERLDAGMSPTQEEIRFIRRLLLAVRDATGEPAEHRPASKMAAIAMLFDKDCRGEWPRRSGADSLYAYVSRSTDFEIAEQFGVSAATANSIKAEGRDAYVDWRRGYEAKRRKKASSQD